MPGPIVDESALVTCSHGGIATPLVPSTRVFVSTGPVITLPGSYAIAGCPLAGVPLPFCATAMVSLGTTRVLSEGVPVVIASSVSTCIATGMPLLFVTTQPRAVAT